MKTVLVLVVLALSGCTEPFFDDADAFQEASAEPHHAHSVDNVRDAFSYAGASVVHTETETYTWENVRGRALVQWSVGAYTGDATLVLRDATGLFVTTYDLDATSAGQQSSTRGVPGDWTLELHYEEFTGSLAFNVVAVNPMEA